MGPRSRERGNAKISVGDVEFDLLQWGRAHVSAEIIDAIAIVNARVFASMGPRSRERGNR